jgi:hypothetical protein
MDHILPSEPETQDLVSKPNVVVQQDTLQALKNNSWNGLVHITSRDDNAVAMLRVLATNTSATSLCIQKRHMNTDKHDALIDVFSRNASLRTINLTKLTEQERNNDQHDVRYKVPSQLFTSKSVRRISLKQVHLDEEACQSLASTLRDEKSLLTTLILVDVDFDPAGLHKIFAALCHARTLTSLTLKNLYLKTDDMHRMTMVLGMNQSIQTLAMEEMKVYDEPSTKKMNAMPVGISNLLARNSTLQSLSIRNNQIGATGFSIICKQGLTNNTSLQKLLVSSNPLGWEGVQCLLEVLSDQGNSTTSTLQHVCLAFTALGVEGCTKVARIIPQCKHLRHLTLDGNDVEKCGEAFLYCLKQAFTISHLCDCLPKLLKKQQQRHYTEWRQVDLLLRANNANRRYLPLSHTDQPNALLPHVLHRAANAAPQKGEKNKNDPSVLFVVLQGISHTFS